MRYVIHIIIIFWPICLKAQTINYEQIALNHFMEKIFDLKYKKVKAIEFSGFTEKVLTKARYGNDCFDDSSRIRMSLIRNAEDKIVPMKKIEISSNYNINIKGINMRNSKRFKLRITCVNHLVNNSYVGIEMLKLNSHIDTFLIEIDKKGNILRWCETGAVF